MEALNPRHNESVIALTNLSNSLISGSSEYLLRTWDYTTGKEKCIEQKREASLKIIQSNLW